MKKTQLILFILFFAWSPIFGQNLADSVKMMREKISSLEIELKAQKEELNTLKGAKENIQKELLLKVDEAKIELKQSNLLANILLAIVVGIGVIGLYQTFFQKSKAIIAKRVGDQISLQMGPFIKDKAESILRERLDADKKIEESLKKKELFIVSGHSSQFTDEEKTAQIKSEFKKMGFQPENISIYLGENEQKVQRTTAVIFFHNQDESISEDLMEKYVTSNSGMPFFYYGQKNWKRADKAGKKLFSKTPETLEKQLMALLKQYFM